MQCEQKSKSLNAWREPASFLNPGIHTEGLQADKLKRPSTEEPESDPFVASKSANAVECTDDPGIAIHLQVFKESQQ